uniref:Uncharacterized protein n=1 Tax=Thiomonas intermedia (strain K12) TaxID=75379 RepID=D5WZK2_THIK1
MTAAPAADPAHPERRGRPRAKLLAGGSCESILLTQIRDEHPLLQQALSALHPRPIDDALTLTPKAIHILCTLHPLVVRPVGGRQSRGYEVLAGLLAWRALRPHHALRFAAQPASIAEPPPDTPANTEESAAPPARAKQRKRAPPTALPAAFDVPAMVLPKDTSDDNITALLCAERWLLITSVGPLKALQTELVQLHDQARSRGWTQDLTPQIKSLNALARVLDVTRQTLSTRRPTRADADDAHPKSATDRP